MSRTELVALSRNIARMVVDVDTPLPPIRERWCACPRPAPARLYLGQWACVCGELIERRRPWTP